MFDRDTFGPYLRRERERRGISLDDIAGRTKIARTWLAKLERGDLADWPSGIFRRAFFRAYAGAIGLDADALLEEFLRIFPDPAAAAAVTPASTEHSAADLRLTLAELPAPRISHANLRGALIDTCGVLLVTAVASAIVGHPGAVAAVVGLLYHATATTLGVRTVGMRLATASGPRGDETETAPAALPARQPRGAVRSADTGRRPSRTHRRLREATAVLRGTRAHS